MSLVVDRSECGQREEAGGILRDLAQFAPAPLGFQGADAGRDVLWDGRQCPKATGSSEDASSGTETEDKPGA